jgi:hypothetical protein
MPCYSLISLIYSVYRKLRENTKICIVTLRRLSNCIILQSPLLKFKSQTEETERGEQAVQLEADLTYFKQMRIKSNVARSLLGP